MRDPRPMNDHMHGVGESKLEDEMMYLMSRSTRDQRVRGTQLVALAAMMEATAQSIRELANESLEGVAAYRSQDWLEALLPHFASPDVLRSYMTARVVDDCIERMAEANNVPLSTLLDHDPLRKAFGNQYMDMSDDQMRYLVEQLHPKSPLVLQDDTVVFRLYESDIENALDRMDLSVEEKVALRTRLSDRLEFPEMPELLIDKIQTLRD